MPTPRVDMLELPTHNHILLSLEWDAVLESNTKLLQTWPNIYLTRLYFFACVGSENSVVPWLKYRYSGCVMLHECHGGSDHRSLEYLFNSIFAPVDFRHKRAINAESVDVFITGESRTNPHPGCCNASYPSETRLNSNPVKSRSLYSISSKNSKSLRHVMACWRHHLKWKQFPRYWPFVWGIHRSPVNSTHKGQWRGALMFSLICAWINGWVNNGGTGDLRRPRAHYDVTLMDRRGWSYH